MSEFTDLADAVKEANRLPYGLAAYAYTRNERTQRLLGEAVEAGMVAINHHGIGVPEVPFGGMKDSGYGTEGGPEALRAHTILKLVSSQHVKADFWSTLHAVQLRKRAVFGPPFFVSPYPPSLKKQKPVHGCKV